MLAASASLSSTTQCQSNEAFSANCLVSPPEVKEIVDVAERFQFGKIANTRLRHGTKFVEIFIFSRRDRLHFEALSKMASEQLGLGTSSVQMMPSLSPVSSRSP